MSLRFSPFRDPSPLAGLRAVAEQSCDGFDLTSRVRDWVYGQVTVAAVISAGDPAGRLLLLDDDYWREDFEALLLTFERRARGALCGGTAWTLHRAYDELGLTSWTFNFGYDERLSHVSTLVRVDDRIVLQDAYLGFALVDADGQPLDVRDAVRRLSSHDHDALALAPRTAPGPRPAVFEADDLARRSRDAWPGWPGTGIERRLRATDERGVGAALVTGMDLDASPTNPIVLEILAALEAHALPRRFEFLLRSPLGLGSHVDGWCAADAATGASDSAALLRELLAAAR